MTRALQLNPGADVVTADDLEVDGKQIVVYDPVTRTMSAGGSPVSGAGFFNSGDAQAVTRPPFVGTAPTITQYANPGVTNAPLAAFVTAMGATPLVKYPFTYPTVFVPNGDWLNQAAGASILSRYQPAGATAARSQMFEFMTDSPLVGLELRFPNSNVEFWVNDMLVNAAVVNTGNVGVDGVYCLLLDMTASAAAAPYKVAIRYSAGPAVRNLWFKSGSSQWATSYRRPMKVGVVGDSLDEGYYAGGVTVDAGWAPFRATVASLARLLGWTRIWNNGQAGTGYVATFAGADLKYADRLAYMSSKSLDLLVTCGGVNDNATDAVTLRAACDAYWASAKALMPNTKMLCVAPTSNAGGTAVVAANAAAIQASALAAGVTFVDANDAWPGTAAMLADTFHPNQLGHDVRAMAIAGKIKAL